MSSRKENSGYSPYHTTGSGELPSLCLEDGKQATTNYGVQTYGYSGTCLKCGSGITITLDFNSVDEHYYARCPVCNTVWRHMNPDGSLSDFKIIKVSVRQKLVKDYNDGFEDNGWL